MTLTDAEKAAGREFREASSMALTALWERDPADLTVPVVVRHFRHLCAAQDGRSVSLEAAEVYQLSPQAIVLDDEVELDFSQPTVPWKAELIPAGRFAFVYKDGKCRRCGITARSRDWLFFDARERAPLRRAS